MFAKVKRLFDLPEQLASIKNQVAEIRALVGPFGIALGDETILVQTLFGNKFFVDSSDLIMAPQLIVYRQWENEISRFILSALDADSIFVDVGANFGYFSVMAATKIGTTGRGYVVSVEPNPRMVDLLHKNSIINWSMAPIKIHQCAAGKKQGRATLFIPKGKASNASLATVRTSAPRDETQVEVRSLDSLVGDSVVTLMKIDVEGFELNVLLGAKKMLARSPNIEILMEWSTVQMEEAGIPPKAVVEAIDALGLSIFSIPPVRPRSPDEWSSLQLDKEALFHIPYTNILLRVAGRT